MVLELLDDPRAVTEGRTYGAGTVGRMGTRGRESADHPIIFGRSANAQRMHVDPHGMAGAEGFAGLPPIPACRSESSRRPLRRQPTAQIAQDLHKSLLLTKS